MRQTIERRACDVCGKVEDHNPDTFGAKPFRGWQVVEWADGPFTTYYYDACSTDCAVALLRNGPTPRIKIAEAFPRTGPAQADSITDRESTREATGRRGVGSSFPDWPADDPPVKAAPGEPACPVCGVGMSTNLRDVLGETK